MFPLFDMSETNPASDYLKAAMAFNATSAAGAVGGSPDRSEYRMLAEEVARTAGKIAFCLGRAAEGFAAHALHWHDDCSLHWKRPDWKTGGCSMTISLYIEHDAPVRLESLSDEQRKISAAFGDGETREYEHDVTIMVVQRLSVDELSCLTV